VEQEREEMTLRYNSRIFLSAIITLLCTSLLGCPDDGPIADGGQSNQNSSTDGGNTLADHNSDAGIMHEDGGSGAQDAGLDAGLDAGAIIMDVGLDAGQMVDAGFICPIDDTEPPEPWGDAGPPPCTIENPQGEGFFQGTWEGHVWGAFSFSEPFDLLGNGTMEFSIICSGNKFNITGSITGLANDDYPFTGQLSGEFFPLSGEIQIIINPATLDLGIAQGQFIANMTGQRQNDLFPDGTWCGISVIPEGSFGEGTWNAVLQQ
jgi:hypothetical protein